MLPQGAAVVEVGAAVVAATGVLDRSILVLPESVKVIGTVGTNPVGVVSSRQYWPIGTGVNSAIPDPSVQRWPRFAPPLPHDAPKSVKQTPPIGWSVTTLTLAIVRLKPGRVVVVVGATVVVDVVEVVVEVVVDVGGAWVVEVVVGA